MSKVYFISDTHFFHKNILKYCERPFKDIDEMSEILIKNWNETIKKEDTVFFLGDLFLGKQDVGKELVKQLNGNKILIIGNHDRYSITYYISIGFKEVYKYPILYKKFFLLSHEPIKFANETSFLNIHGHIHNNGYRKDMNINENNYFNVSVENINYTPIDFIEIKKIRGFD